MEVRLPLPKRQRTDEALSVLVRTPGELVTDENGFMRGHGTLDGSDISKGITSTSAAAATGKNVITASVAGLVSRVNRLVSVRPVHSRYVGEVGDVIIGRIVEVGQKRWKVDLNARLNAVLMLSSVNLPGGILRRRSEADELMMREYIGEGELISAEVHSTYSDGALSLHTRSLKYGKLKHGTLVRVPALHVRRCKTHFHTLPCGVGIIIGMNGFIWICPSLPTAEDNHVHGTTKVTTSEDVAISKETRDTIARVRNSVMALAAQMLPVFDTTIIYTFDAAQSFSTKEMLLPETIDVITQPALDLVQAERIGNL